ncbi:type III-B CRISPR module RAMP protein Cmr1 [Thermomonas fusca]
MSIRKTRPAPDFNGIGEAAAGITHREGDTLTYDCTLVTPMYGGGVKAGEVDTLMPIRATAIRGQLRFWWRLLNRKRFANSHAMFEAERAIWGGLGDETSLAKSKVVVSVVSGSVPPADLVSASSYPRDALFHALFAAVQNKSQLRKENARFKLKLNLGSKLSGEQRQQAIDALRWWASFGGVGARTRRGCGAVHVKNVLPVNVQEAQARDCRLVLNAPVNDPIDAWRQAVKAMQQFRQGDGLGRNPAAGGSKSPPGRSRWPEPDAIRRLTTRHSSRHAAPVCDKGDIFPRAAFGLPIVFMFKDEEAGDPNDTTLKPIPEGRSNPVERMSSPLTLRPYFDGKSWRPAVLCLNLDHIKKMGVSLRRTEGDKSLKDILPGQWQAGAMADQIGPMRGRGEDAIEAFLNYFREQVVAVKQTSAATRAIEKVKVFDRPNITLRGDKIIVDPHGHARRELAGETAQRLLNDLSDYARQRLKAGKPFNRLELTFDGHEYMSLKEYQA